MKSTEFTVLSVEASRRRALCEQSREFYTAKIPEVAILSAADALQRQNIILVDVRTVEERRVGMIKGAIARDEFETRYPTVNALPEGAEVAPYCTIGFRSGLYARELINDKGFSSSQVLNHEGILMHTYERQPLVSGDSGDEQQSPQVHTYAYPWSGLADPTFEVRYFGIRGFLANLCKIS